MIMWLYRDVPMPGIGIISNIMEYPKLLSEIDNRFFTKVYIIVYTQANPSCGNEEMLNVFSEDGLEARFFDLNTVRIG